LHQISDPLRELGDFVAKTREVNRGHRVDSTGDGVPGAVHGVLGAPVGGLSLTRYLIELALHGGGPTVQNIGRDLFALSYRGTERSFNIVPVHFCLPLAVRGQQLAVGQFVPGRQSAGAETSFYLRWLRQYVEGMTMARQNFDWADPFDLASQLTEEERMV